MAFSCVLFLPCSVVMDIIPPTADIVKVLQRVKVDKKTVDRGRVFVLGNRNRDFAPARSVKLGIAGVLFTNSSFFSPGDMLYYTS